MDGSIRPSLFCEIIDRWAAETPGNPCFVAKDLAALSYADLSAMLGTLAAVLRDAGIAHGHRVAVVHSGGAEAAATLLAVLRTAVIVPLNPAFTADEFAHHYRRRRVDAVIVDAAAGLPAREVALRLGLPLLEVRPDGSHVAGRVVLRRLSEGRPAPPRSDQPADLASVLATSGTTNEGKVVPIRHCQMIARAAADAAYLDLRPDDRLLNMNRLFLGGGIANLASILYAGGSVVLMKTPDVEELLESIGSLEPTWYVGSFTVNKALYEVLKTRAQAIETGRLRFIRTSSGAIDPAVADTLQALFGVPVIEAYSSTESGRICGNPRPPGLSKRGSVGPPVCAEIRIIGDGGRDVIRGETGEVAVRGPKVFDGYEDDADANAAAFIDGWYRTGDQGFLDDDGYLTLTGRIEEMINRGGEKISPIEIDTALAGHPAVREAAAFAIRHPTLGEIAGAAIVPETGESPSAADLNRFLKTRLSPFKRPAAFLFVDEIPRGPSGKIQRGKLADAFRDTH